MFFNNKKQNPIMSSIIELNKNKENCKVSPILMVLRVLGHNIDDISKLKANKKITVKPSDFATDDEFELLCEKLRQYATVSEEISETGITLDSKDSDVKPLVKANKFNEMINIFVLKSKETGMVQLGELEAIYRVAKYARKIKIRNMTIIISSIAIAAVTAGIIAAILIKKRSDDDDIITSDDESVDDIDNSEPQVEYNDETDGDSDVLGEASGF